MRKLSTSIEVGAMAMIAVPLLVSTACISGGPIFDDVEKDPHEASELQDESALVQDDGWLQPTPDEDPFWHMGASAEHDVCTQKDWKLELTGLEVNTSECNYLTLTQPLLRTLQGGATVDADVWWQELASLEPATGRLKLRIGDVELFDVETEIPGPADARSASVVLTEAIPEGSPIYFHVSNHGSNSWTLGDISSGMEEEHQHSEHEDEEHDHDDD